jgi:hypothetical protein
VVAADLVVALMAVVVVTSVAQASKAVDSMVVDKSQLVLAPAEVALGLVGRASEVVPRTLKAPVRAFRPLDVHRMGRLSSTVVANNHRV